MSTPIQDVNETKNKSREKNPSIVPVLSSVQPLETKSATMRSEYSESDLLNIKDIKTPTSNQSRIKSASSTKSSKKLPIRKDKLLKSPICNNKLGKLPNSSIPLRVKSPRSPTKVPETRITSRPMNPSNKTLAQTNKTNKHTLEIQFLNKKKRLEMLKKEMNEKQRPVLDLYNSLAQTKKKLEEFGKVVQLEEIKLIPVGNVEKNESTASEVNADTVVNMKTTLEDMPKALITVCQNLLNRQATIGELLESVVKSEIDMTELSKKMDSFDSEKNELEKLFNLTLANHEQKINELIHNWQSLLNCKKYETDNIKIDELQQKLHEKDEIIAKFGTNIKELQRKVEDKKNLHDNTISELNGLVFELQEKIANLEQNVENEKKLTLDYKTKNSTNSQTIKMMKNKIVDLEVKGKEFEEKNNELNKKLKYAQEQLKTKECQWIKEKEEFSKNLKCKESLLDRLTNDRNDLEARCKKTEEQSEETTNELKSTISTLQIELNTTKEQLENASSERDEINKKFNEIQEHIKMMSMENKQEMDPLSQIMECCKNAASTDSEKENVLFVKLLAHHVQVRELEEKLKQMEKKLHAKVHPGDSVDNDTQIMADKHSECISRYQRLLEQFVEKLNEKSKEVSPLRTEVQNLEQYQEALEEQMCAYPAEGLHQLAEDGRLKLNELIKKLFESEQRIDKYESIIEKQKKKMNEMENLIRYKERMTDVLKKNRGDLVMDKQNLLIYSQEVRTALDEVTGEVKIKERIIEELQEKLDLRECQVNKLEKEVKELEANLAMTNEKLFQLRGTFGSLEKELQTKKALSNEYSVMQTRYDIVGRQNSTNIITVTGVTLSSSFFNLSNSNTYKNNEDQKNDNMNYHTSVSSLSLIDISMKKLNILRSRLQQLNKVNNMSDNKEILQNNTLTNNTVACSCSTQTVNVHQENKPNKVNFLINLVKRYEQFQMQKDACYQQLCEILDISED